MAANAIEFDELRIEADGRQALSQFLLLMYRKQNIGLDTNDKRALELQTLEPRFQRPAVLGQIKQVGRA